MAEVEHALGAYYVCRPIHVDITVKLVKVERTAAEVDKCPDTVFFGFTLSIVMVVMVMLVMMVMVLVMMVMVLVIIVVIIKRLFYLMHPCRRSGHRLEVKEPCVDYILKRNIGIVTLYNTGLGL